MRQPAKHQECLGKTWTVFTYQSAWMTSRCPHENSCYRLGKRTSKDISTMFPEYGFTMYAVFMSDDLLQKKFKLLKGNEHFRGRGVRKSLRLLDYWRWSGSVLLDNTARGILAEFLIATALGLHKKPRREWAGFDFRTASGTTIEVKSSAYVHSWSRKHSKPSVINFGIAPRRSFWDAETGEYKEGFKRWADIYVFCVFTGKRPLHPLDTSKWDFYIIPTETLDQKCLGQKTIRLSSLEKLSPRKCSYADLKRTFLDVERELKL